MSRYLPGRRGHRFRYRRSGSIACAVVAAAGLLPGCADRNPSSPSHPGGVMPVGASGVLVRAETMHRPAPDPAIKDSVAAQPEGRGGVGSKVEFVGPRPPDLPFRMDLSPGPPEPPAAIELSSVTFDEAAQNRLRRLLCVEMAKYPSDVLESVSQVYVGGTLTYNGEAVGGFHFLGMVFIAAGEQDAGAWTDAHVARAFHHEVSHALMDAHRAKFDAARFREALPAGFVYTEERPVGVGGSPVIEEGPHPGPGPGEDSPSLDLLHEGFLVPWAKRGMDEDFASYAEVLLRRPELLLVTFAPESRVGRKARVVRDFYVAIDPRFEAVLEPRRR